MSAERPRSYRALVWREFRKNRRAVASLYGILALLAVAVLADFIANDMPYYVVVGGRTYYPILIDYGSRLGVTSWPEPLRGVDFKRLTEAPALFGICFLCGIGEQGKGVAQVLESLRRVILHNEPGFVAPALFERHNDFGYTPLVPCVLYKLEQGELLSLAFENLRQTLLVHFKPVVHFAFPISAFALPYPSPIS